MSFGAEDDADADADADGFRNGCNESDSDVGKSEDEYDGGYMDMGIEGVGVSDGGAGFVGGWGGGRAEMIGIVVFIC